MSDKIAIDTLIYEDQYRLKLGLKYFLLSKEALLAIAVCYLLFDSFTLCMGIMIMALLGYSTSL